MHSAHFSIATTIFDGLDEIRFQKKNSTRILLALLKNIPLPGSKTCRFAAFE